MDDDHARDTTDDESRYFRDAIDPADEVFVKAPPSDDPACSMQVDAVPFRGILQSWADGVRADAGQRPVSAEAYRRRRAQHHRRVALEFAQRRKVAVGLGLEEDELCRSVQAAMDTQVIGSCAYCGCNFSVVAVMDVPGWGNVCGLCGRRVRVYNPVQLVRNPPANADEWWKGWLPWLAGSAYVRDF